MPSHLRGDRDRPDERAVIRLTTGAIAVVVAVAGCAAPAAQQSTVPSAAATATTSAHASVSEAPASAEPGSSASTEPTATPPQGLGFQVPDGILPPFSLARVVVDALNIRFPELDGPVVASAGRGEVLYVSTANEPVVVDGVGWYQVEFIAGWDGWPAYPPGTQNSWTGWAAVGSGADRYLEILPP